MVPIPLIDESDSTRLVTYPTGRTEDLNGSIIDAFLAADVDVFGKSTTLSDWINTDAVANIHYGSDRSVYLVARIWDHWTVVTTDEVRIYQSGPTDEQYFGGE